MPASRKVTRADIIDAAFEVLRTRGFAAVNARSVAAELGCSTQPIYLSFANMDELKCELTTRAVDEHVGRVISAIRDNDGTRSHYSDYGLGFIHFAVQEKQLFRWLYLEDGQIGKKQIDVLLPEIIKTIVSEYGYSEETALNFHRDMSVFAYGLAILLNSGSIVLSDYEIARRLARNFLALTSLYGAPPIPHDYNRYDCPDFNNSNNTDKEN